MSAAGSARGTLQGMQPLHGERSPDLQRGLDLARQGRAGEAAPLLRMALLEAPTDLEARLCFADALLALGDPNQAIHHLRRALLQDPGCEGAYERLAPIYRACAAHRALGDLLTQWRTVAPDRPELRWEEGALAFLEGRFDAAWEAMEARFQVKGQVISLMGPFDRPAWDGRPFPGQTLLLHWEQGLGDTLMFIRFARLAKSRGGRVIAVVQPPLVPLLEGVEGLDEVVPDGAPLPAHDLQLPLMSLPRVLNIHRPEDLETPGPYLKVPAHSPNREMLSRVLRPHPGRRRIGYLWAGGAAYLNNATRSLPPEALAPLGALADCDWHCFQLPAPAAQPLPSTVLGPWLTDFSDTAFALAQMDLVLTVDTALVHLAGGLGLPARLLLPLGADWRWGREATRTPWYPTVRLVRQPRPGDWAAVIDAVLADLGGPQEGR